MSGCPLTGDQRREGLAGAMGLDASSFGENLAARFARITGVGAALPAAP